MKNFEKHEMEIINFDEHDMFNYVVTSDGDGTYSSGGTVAEGEIDMS